MSTTSPIGDLPEPRAVAIFACDPRIEAARKPIVGGHSVAVHAALLADTVERFRTLGAAVVLVWRGEEARARALAPRAVISQRGRSFGDRIANAARDVAALGYARMTLVGADCPALSAADVSAALGLLDRVDVAIGPADDGGVNLIALRSDSVDKIPLAELPWETERLRYDLEDALRAAGLRHELLAMLADVDTAGSLERYLRAAPESLLARLVDRILQPPTVCRDAGSVAAREPLLLFGSSFLKSPPG